MTLEHFPDIQDAVNTRGIVMPAKPIRQRVYLDQNAQAVIACPQYMRHRPLDANPYMGSP